MIVQHSELLGMFILSAIEVSLYCYGLSVDGINTDISPVGHVKKYTVSIILLSWPLHNFLRLAFAFV